MVNCQNRAIQHSAIVTRGSRDNGLLSADFSNHKDEETDTIQ